METYAQALTYAIPFFMVLIALEAFAGWRRGIQVNKGADTISSLSSGMTNTIKDVLGLGVALVSYAWLVERIAIFHIESTFTVYVLAFIALDFAGYWMHRLSHEVNFLWNRHIIHHSSEEFNLSCALRQTISEIFSFFALLLVPAALLGVPSEVISVVAPIQLFAQFWYHTTLIHRMGFLEKILVTPAHHRVHHAINTEYLDKNYSQIFIIWDKIFGTFQEELAEKPPVYGVKRPVKTWNPVRINFQHIWVLIQDAWRTHNWLDKLQIWFKPTGWRPADVAAKYPLEIVEDAYAMEKYDSKPGRAILGWAWFQLVLNLVLLFYMLSHFAEIGFPGLLWYGLYLFVSVFAYTTLLDKDATVVWAELVRFGLGVGLIFWQNGDWFGLNSYIPFATSLLALLMVSSLGLTVFFQQKHFKQSELV